MHKIIQRKARAEDCRTTCVAAKATRSRKQLVEFWKLSGPVEHNWTAVLFGERSGKVSRKSKDLPAAGGCAAVELGLLKCTSCATLEWRSFDFQAGAELLLRLLLLCCVAYYFHRDECCEHLCKWPCERSAMEAAKVFLRDLGTINFGQPPNG